MLFTDTVAAEIDVAGTDAPETANTTGSTSSSGVDRRHLASISDQIRQVATSGSVVLLISHDEDLLALAADQELMLTSADGSAQQDTSGDIVA